MMMMTLHILRYVVQLLGKTQSTTLVKHVVRRVRTRVVVVVVMVRELLFLVMSVFCVQIRGRGTEVTTTPYHIRSYFRLKRRSYHNGFVILFLRYLSCEHKSFYRYSLELGTLGVDHTIFGITLSVCLYICPSVYLSVILSM